MQEAHAKFHPGQVIHHKKFDYRGVIVDVDQEFSGTEEWYDEVALSRPPKDQPWYTVLVDDETIETYVAERHLEQDAAQAPVTHPLVEKFFDRFEGGVYHLRVTSN